MIAIDGPSGAGKGTVARTVASELAYRHIDTGAMYRAVAWKALHDGLDLTDGDAVAAVARASVIEVDGRVTIDGHDVTDAIRTPVIDRAAAVVAQHQGVRAALVERQRRYGAEGGVVMEGRDIGSVVFPDASLKLYITASPRVRAERRVAEIGGHVEEVEASIIERDRKDSTRADSPLHATSDAVVVDTSGLTIDEVVEHLLAMVP